MYPPPAGRRADEPIAEECIALIAKQKSISPGQIRLDSTLEELSLDSLDRVSIAFDLKKYDIEFPKRSWPDQDREHMVTGSKKLCARRAPNLPQPHDARGHHGAGCMTPIGQDVAASPKSIYWPQRHPRDDGSAPELHSHAPAPSRISARRNG